MRHYLEQRSPGIATPWGAFLVCLIVTAIALATDFAVAPESVSLTREAGPVELCSAGFYLLALAALCMRSTVARAWPGMIALLAMFLRELDADKRFTSEGLLSTKIFVYETADWEKFLAAVVLLTLLASIGILAWRGGPKLARALVRRRPWAGYFALAAVLAVISKSIDGLGRKLAEFGITVPNAVSARAGRMEEWMELGIPVLLVISILAMRPAQAA